MLKETLLAGRGCPVKLPISFASDLHRVIYLLWSIELSLLHLSRNKIHFFCHKSTVSKSIVL